MISKFVCLAHKSIWCRYVLFMSLACWKCIQYILLLSQQKPVIGGSELRERERMYEELVLRRTKSNKSQWIYCVCVCIEISFDSMNKFVSFIHFRVHFHPLPPLLTGFDQIIVCMCAPQQWNYQCSASQIELRFGLFFSFILLCVSFSTVQRL